MKTQGLHALQVGANFGEWSEMEPITDTDCDSQMTPARPKKSSASRGKVGSSAPKSKKRSKGAGAKDGTRPAGWKPAGSEVGLSILQAGFDQALDEGLKARVWDMKTENRWSQGGILIEVSNAYICPNCQLWTGELICPACQTQIG